MGTSQSRLEKALGQSIPEEERYFGLSNFGNTCYGNSVLQALYFCVPFREHVLEYYTEHMKSASSSSSSAADEGLLPHLGELFFEIKSQKKKTGYLSPKKFINELREQNELFSGYMQQDAHEFLNFLLNDIVDTLHRDMKRRGLVSPDKPLHEVRTWIHDIFEGVMIGETRCLCCESVTNRKESFLDISVDVFQNSSITYCMKNFSSVETLEKEDKFFCNNCLSLQEAQKRMRVKKPPLVLIMHLKRFKYLDAGRQKKLTYRVSFPFELRIMNTADTKDQSEMYDLFAVVIHIGSGPHHGHYTCMVKSRGNWLHFDDDIVELIDESTVRNVFGSPQEGGTCETGYLLFYQLRKHKEFGADIPNSDQK